MLLPPGAKLLMIGDSVTDVERARPVGERASGLGQGYVSLVDALVATALPDHGLRVLNVGTSGDTVRHLEARWEGDVLGHRPDWVSVMIGINDVWRQFDSPRETKAHVLLPEFEATLTRLVDRTLPGVNGMILMTPFFVEPNRSDPMRALMDRYGGAVRRVAEARGTAFADTQAAFDRLLAHVEPAAIAPDRVHPSHIGHMVLARTFLQAIGFAG